MRNILESMDVGKDVKTTDDVEAKKAQLIRLNETKGKYIQWILSIVLSITPLFVLPFVRLINYGNISDALYIFFSDANLIFVVISFTITATMDFTAEIVKKEKHVLLQRNSIFIIIGTIVYTIIVTYSDSEKDIDMNFVCIINIIYFISMVTMSSSRYIKQIREAKKAYEYTN